ncbi:hypothetical protein EYF80_048430 [Liparis tanakae]|uniref:Uncharacterized protein n=1 Tax=Liparis tanakae TaxID=230148 RepID=A0A4Z2FKX7_9TELE|nr:hypothetical protein EYF80_048430 [Liparis tanakae]
MADNFSRSGTLIRPNLAFIVHTLGHSWTYEWNRSGGRKRRRSIVMMKTQRGSQEIAAGDVGQV